MDRDEVARRLDQIREAVRAELAAKAPETFDESVRQEVPVHLPAGVGMVLEGQPELAATDDLRAANANADLLAPQPSQAPLVGPVINLLRWLGRPFVKVFAGSYLARQQHFNAHAVRHMNELGNLLEARIRRIEEALELWSENPRGLEVRMMRALKDYDAALRQRHMTLFSALEEEVLQARVAAARVQKLEEKFVERALAVDARFGEKDQAAEQVTGMFNERIAEVRERAGTLSAAVDRLEGQMSEVMAMRSLLRKALDSAAPLAASPAAADDGAVEPSAWSELGAMMGDEDYRSFQDRFRGDPEIIAERMAAHVGRFDGAPGVVADLGCGRGEFLDLLRDAGIDAVGVEINAADVEECRRRDHQAEVADLFEWLQQRDDDSLGGIFMAQVIEHLPPGDWQRFIELAAGKVAAGGNIVVETINPESLYAMARAYVIDPTHVRPVHPELLAFLARRAGLHPVEVEYQSPVPDDERPGGLEFFQQPSATLSQDLVAMKEALVRLDRICCAPQEYTLQATRPGGTGE